MLSDWLKSFQNVSEVRVPVKCPVRKGKLPSGLRGTYYKASPGEFYKYGVPVAHPFDGDGYVSAFRFGNDEDIVEFHSSFVNTYHRQLESGLHCRLFMGAFGTPPMTPFIKNPANTSVIEWGGCLLVFCESGPPYVLDPKTLKTRGVLQPFKEGLPMRIGIRFVDDLMHGLGVFGDAVGAHPKICKADAKDVLVLYSISFQGDKSKVTFYELNDRFQITHTVSYEVSNALYFVHDFQVTKDYYFFVEHSVNFDWNKVQSHGLVNSVEMIPSKPYNVLHAVPRNANVKAMQKEVLPGMVTHYAGLPMYKQNSVGAEADATGERAADVAAGTYTFHNVLYPSRLIDWNNLSEQGGQLYRTQWNMNTGDIFQSSLVDHFLEFPVVDKKNTLFANISVCNKRGLLAMDIEGRQKHYWFISNREFLSEPVVAGEWVLVVKYNAESHDSVMLVFDAADISKGPLCEIDTPEAMPIGLHGWWSDTVI